MLVEVPTDVTGATQGNSPIEFSKHQSSKLQCFALAAPCRSSIARMTLFEHY